MLRAFGTEFTGQNMFEHISAEIKGPEAPGERWKWLPTRMNVVDPFVRGQIPSPRGVPCYNLPSHSTGTSRHVFRHSSLEGQVGVGDHCWWDNRPDRCARFKKEFVFNQCIFDFERYEFDAERSENEGPDGFEYNVSVTDLAKEVSPFYHAAAEHYSADFSIETKAYDGNTVPSNWSGNKRIQVKPKKMEGDEWVVTVEWPITAFPITL
jgi:hypothetical protein